MKIIVVDDKKENIYLLETLFKKDKHEVTSVANGVQAIERLRDNGFDLIISDILMSEMDGFQLCKEVKSNATLKHIPFIFYTATYTEEKDEELALKLGADGFIRKPIEPGEFLSIIEDTLKKVEAGQIKPTKPAKVKEEDVLKLYSERLVKKLEQKMLELEREIAERKMAEATLRKSEAQLENALKIAHLGPWEYDVARDTFTFTDSFYAIFRTTSEQVGGYTMSSADYVKRFVHPEDMDVVAVETRKAIETRDPNFNRLLEHRILYADGEVGHITVRFFIVKDETGKTIRTYGVNQDITERKQAEEALRESEERFRNIFENSVVGLYRTKPDGKFLMANPALLRMLGYSSFEELTERNLEENDFEPDSPRASFIQRIESDGMVTGLESSWKRKDDSTVFVRESARAFKDETGKILYLEGTVEDITKRRLLQQQLLQSEKMSALGQLISGVAHELNNPLTGVLGFSQLLLMSKDLPQDARQTLEKIQQEAERARKIVQNLLTFARQRPPERRRIDVNDVIRRTLDLRAYEMKVSNIEVVRNLDADLPLVFADEHQLQQVFMNLIINAEQAMLGAHGKGNLTVESRPDPDGEVIILTFRDDGPGIAAENLSRVFDPFFTTKPDGKGTGLGLSISHGIVEEHGGTISVESERGNGTLFTITLPIAEGHGSEFGAKENQLVCRSEPGSKRILVIDDEDNIADIVRAALEKEGHTVDIARDGRIGSQKIESGDYDAVVSDCKMPGKSGLELYLDCKEKKPQLAKRFLFLTGDVISQDTIAFIKRHKLPYVSKPFDLKKLILSVNDLFETA